MVWTLCLLLAAAEPSPTDTLAKVQSAYQKGGDLTASFSQIYVDKLRGKKKTETGKLWAKTDGRVRWTYEKPARKDFVFTGATAYFYEPDNSQVTVFDKFQNTPLWNALRFLWGQGTITKTFDVRVCDEACAKSEPGDVLIKLVPKEPIAAVDHVEVAIDTKAMRVRRSMVFDSLGNRTEYHFLDVKLGAAVDAKKFDFKIPEGVSVIRANSDG